MAQETDPIGQTHIMAMNRRNSAASNSPSFFPNLYFLDFF